MRSLSPTEWLLAPAVPFEERKALMALLSDIEIYCGAQETFIGKMTRGISGKPPVFLLLSNLEHSQQDWCIKQQRCQISKPELIPAEIGHSHLYQIDRVPAQGLKPNCCAGEKCL